jgi:hypothetical protein
MLALCNLKTKQYAAARRKQHLHHRHPQQCSRHARRHVVASSVSLARLQQASKAVLG